MEKSEIKATLLGQTVRHSSTWTSGCTSFVIRDVTMDDRYVNLRGGGTWDIASVPCGKIEELILLKRVLRETEIDHCSVVDTYELLPGKEEVFQKEIEDTKMQIKKLKKKLQAQQADYENYLVSSVRISVLEQAMELLRNEFIELKSQIESMTCDEVMETYCTLGESDNEILLDVSDCGWEYLEAVYVDMDDDGTVTVSPENVIINNGQGKTRNVNIQL